VTVLLFQISAVSLVSLACGRFARLMGQAGVIGEIFGGILLGPSVFGRFAPSLFGRLLNTRGLVELVVLNIAYSVGVFSQTFFTMMVVMALVTTATTVPILNLLRVSTVGVGRDSSLDHASATTPTDLRRPFQ